MNPAILPSNLKPSDVNQLEYIEENLTAVNMSGSGITKSLLQSCQSTGIPALALMVYASDGDNTVDALVLYKESSRIFHFLPQTKFGEPPSKIRIPYVWHQHLGITPKFTADDEEQNLVTVRVGPSGKSKKKTGNKDKKFDEPPATIF